MFEKGKPKLGGRRVGTRNKLPRQLKEEVLRAAHEVGELEWFVEELPHPNRPNQTIRRLALRGSGFGGRVGYLKSQAIHNPTAFIALLGRILPLEVSAEPGTFHITVSETQALDALEEGIARIASRGSKTPRTPVLN
jgi:hypothetical protein